MRFALCVALLVAALAGLASGQVCILSGLKETYFEGRNFTGSALHTGMGVPFRNWGFNSPVPGVVPKNNFAVRWQGDLTPPTTGDYRFRIGSDDGYRLYINGVLHCSAWIVRFFRTTTECRPISFNGGQKYAIMIEFFEQFETARIEGAWILPGDTLPTRIPDSAYSYDNCTAPEIVVNPAPVQINSATEQATVNVHLAVRPSSDVKVTLESDCMYFEVCDLTFTPLNYNTPVPVKAVMKASFTDNCCPIRAVGTGGDLNYLGVFKNFTACRIDAKTSTAISFGDPHMTTFDGVHYDFFNVGDYYLVRHVSGQFAVQTRQGPCASVSCNFGVAVKYRSSVVTVFVASATGAPQLIITGNPAGEGVSLQVTSSRYIVTTPNGIVTYINIGHWTAKNLYYISVKVVSGPANAGLLYGLAGKYDGNPANDWTTSGGVLTTVKNTFANSWLVPQAQNLFADPAATIPAILGGSTAPAGSFVPQPCSKTPEVPPVPLCQANCSVPDPAPTPCTTNCVEPDCKVYPNATFEAQAKASCGQWFNDSTASCCAQYLSGNPFYETCLCDYVLTQSDAFNLDHVDAFYQACASAASKVGGSCDLCPKACSGHGTCSNGKCFCVSGYSGDDCGHKEDDNPTVDPVAATPGKYCNTSLTITGTGFYGTLSCRFSNNLGVSVTTPATATSAFSLTCLLPTVQGSLGATLNLEVVRLTGSYTATSAPATITLKDSCCKNPCLNGGTCSEVADGILCDCPVPFSGALCGNAGCSSSSAYGGTVGPSKNNFEDAVTCPVGKILRATTPCTAGGSYGTESVTCVTISGSCPAQAFASAYFPKTAAGASALGQCDPGYSGTPLRNCDEAGSWSSSLSGSCELIFCPSVTEDGITWPQTFAGSFYATTCSGDLVGAPSRICNPDGTWALISNPCVSSVNCPPDNYAHASWPATSFNATATGLCDAGYAGTPKRFCQENGSWSVSVFNACQRQSCAPLDDGSATYPGTLSGDISIGTCKQGLVGTPARKCQLDLKWGPEFGGSCV